MLPDPSIPPAEYWARLTAVPRPHEIVDFPRKGADGLPVCRVAVMTLTSAEAVLCKAEASKRAVTMLRAKSEKEASNTEGYREIYNDLLGEELLFRACKREDDLTRPFFAAREHISKHLSPDEVGVLLVHYQMVMTQCSPIVSQMSEDEMEAWVSTLVKGGNFAPLASASVGLLIALVIFLASQRYSLQTDSS